jgi:uncharacterized protein YecE (DUF72 family)
VVRRRLQRSARRLVEGNALTTPVNIYVGTSGWAYKEWKGSFYPAKIPAEDMLHFYAGRFPAVEVNNSFYRIPAERVLMGWAQHVPERFRFVMKASRRITHNNRLKDEDDSLGYFLRAVSPLGARLGPTLFQLPPTLKKDVDLLKGFLTKLPRRWVAAMEFRHPSWFDDQVYELLRSHGVALVAVDEDEAEGKGSPLVPTASWGYLRLRRSAYDTDMLQRWAATIRSQSWNEVYVFLKHEDGTPHGPTAAAEMEGILAKVS